MVAKIISTVCCLITAFITFGQLANTPPYNGGDVIDNTQGLGATRMGFVVRTDNWIYNEHSFDEWYKERGEINPSETPGLLSNPYRTDGTGLSTYMSIPAGFTGHVSVYSEGNKWPYIGSNQPAQGHCGICPDAGVYFVNGKREETVEPLFVEGSIYAPKIKNNTPYSIVLTVGSFPGNEQPGQSITIINPGQSTVIPVPPQGWWNDAIPELYASVAGLHPLDINGWHNSSHATSIYGGGIGLPDFGTPGFAYTLNTKHGTSSFLPNYLWGGLNSNEGYDPIVSGDPGYGIAFYLDGNLEGVIDIKPDPANPYLADAKITAKLTHNPQNGDAGFGATQLKCMPVYEQTRNAEYVLITHEEAKLLLNQYSNVSGWTSAYKQYQSNPSAVIQNIPLPSVIPGVIYVNAVDDEVEVNEDTLVFIDPIINDFVSSNLFTFDIVIDPLHGDAPVSDGLILYIPYDNFNGLDSLKYQLCDNENHCSTAWIVFKVNPINDKPLAVDDFVTLSEQEATIIDVQENDSDLDNAHLQTIILTHPENGTSSVVNNDSIHYLSDNNYIGLDSLEYVICDLEPLCDTAWVVIYVESGSVGLSNLNQLTSITISKQGKSYQFTSTAEFVLELFTINGSLVYSSNSPKKEIVLNTDCFSKGIYFLKVTEGNKQETFKFLVE